MIWGIRKSWNGFEPIEIVKETAKMLVYKHPAWGDTRTEKQKILPWRGDEDTASSLCAKLNSAHAEYERRTKAASVWYKARKEEIFASAGEAGTAETVQQGSVHEHAAPGGGDAQAVSDAPKE